MKVLLKQSVLKLGERDDVVDVKDGYARNFLLPQGLAEVATDFIIRQAEERRGKQKKERVERLIVIKSMLKKLEGTNIKVTGLADEDGTLYAAISTSVIVEALKVKGFDVAESDIDLKEPLKSIGEHAVQLDFGENITTSVVVDVGGDGPSK